VICFLPNNHFVNPGHVLVVPKIEVDYIFDLEPALYHTLWDVAYSVAEPLKELTSAERIGIAVEGFSVHHVHIHLCPLYNHCELDPHRNVNWPETQRDAFVVAMKKKLAVRR